MAKKPKHENIPPTPEEIEQRKAELWGNSHEYRGKVYPPIQRRYIEAGDLKERLAPEGDYLVYDAILRTNRHLTRTDLNEALLRGFAAGDKRTAGSRGANEVEPYHCLPCSQEAGYRVLVSIKPCPVCEERKWRAKQIGKTGLD